MLPHYFLSFLLNIAIEFFTAFSLGYRRKKYWQSLFLINAITHPVLNYFLLLWVFAGLEISLNLLILLELIVVFSEWKLLIYILGGNKKKLFLLSVSINIASFGLGLLWFYF